ncbi:MAG: GNAT family N-acyltransferase [Gemmobacter sp.]
MVPLCKGRYRVRPATGPGDIRAVQHLRGLCFRGGHGPDADAFDPLCRHMLIEEAPGGTLVGCFRLLAIPGGEIGTSYSAQFYELSALRRFKGPMAELGRFCIRPDRTDPDILRLAWAALTRFVDHERIGMLFGCSSFRGTETEAYADTFAMLRERHLAPKRWWPRVKAQAKAQEVYRFARRLSGQRPDPARALRSMPPLLRSYLAMGGWVSDHAVVDRDLGTLHVFTGLEIAAVPPARARLLRADAVGAV